MLLLLKYSLCGLELLNSRAQLVLQSCNGIIFGSDRSLDSCLHLPHLLCLPLLQLCYLQHSRLTTSHTKWKIGRRATFIASTSKQHFKRHLIIRLHQLSISTAYKSCIYCMRPCYMPLQLTQKQHGILNANRAQNRQPER